MHILLESIQTILFFIQVWLMLNIEYTESPLTSAYGHKVFDS